MDGKRSDFSKATILFIDDEPKIVRRVGDILADSFDVIRASSAAEGIALLEKHPEIAVAVCDHQMPNMSGIEFFRMIRKTYPRVVRVLATALQRYSLLVEAINDAQVFGYIDKAWSFDLYKLIIDDAISHHYRGNLSSGLIEIPSNRSAARAEIVIEGASVEDFRELLGLMIRIERKALPDQDLEGKFSIVQNGDKLLVSYVDPENHRAQSRRLDHFRGQLEIVAKVENSRDDAVEVDCEIACPLDVRSEDGDKTLISSPQAREETRSEPWLTELQIVRLQATLNQIQCHLSVIRTRSAHRGKALDPFGSATRGGDFLAELEALIDQCRRLHESETIVFKDYMRLKKDLVSLLDSVNRSGSLLRGILLAGTIDGSVINGLFVAYNSLAVFGMHSTIIPDPALFSTAEIIKGGVKERFVWGLFFALLALGPLFWMGKVASRGGAYFEFIKTSSFLIIVVVALASAIIGGTFAGKAAIKGTISAPHFLSKPLRLGATSGFAIFCLVLILGFLFLKGD